MTDPPPNEKQTPSGSAPSPATTTPSADTQREAQATTPPGDRPKPEEIAATWKQSEYREWVQSQVANKMLVRLSAIGIGSLFVFGTAYFGLQNFVLKTQQSDIESAVVSKIDPRAESIVLKHLVVRSALVEKAKE